MYFNVGTPAIVYVNAQTPPLVLPDSLVLSERYTVNPSTMSPAMSHKRPSRRPLDRRCRMGTLSEARQFCCTATGRLQIQHMVRGGGCWSSTKYVLYTTTPTSFAFLGRILFGVDSRHQRA